MTHPHVTVLDSRFAQREVDRVFAGHQNLPFCSGLAINFIHSKPLSIHPIVRNTPIITYNTLTHPRISSRIWSFMVDFRITWTLRTGEVRNADRMKKKSACGNLSLGFTPQNLAYREGVSFRTYYSLKCLLIFRIHHSFRLLVRSVSSSDAVVRQ